MTPGRVLRALRPAEWAVLGFWGLAALRLSLQGRVSSLGGGSFDTRSREVFVVLCISGTLLLARSYFKTAAPVPPRLRPLLAISFAVCALPAPLAFWVRINHPIWLQWETFDTANRLFQVSLLFVLTAGAATPTMAAWLFSARELRLRPESTAAQVARAALASLVTHLREWWPLLVMISSYWLMDELIGAPANGGYDEVMRDIDRVLGFGVEPVLRLERIVNVPLSEWCAFSYTFYAFEYPLCLGAIFAAGGRSALREGVTALTIALGVAFFSYSVVPVRGPVLSMEFQVPLDMYLNGPTKEMLMDRTRIIWDCFPSLHTAASMLLSWACFRHARRVFWLTLPMIATTPFACVYLRYHYLVDVLAGAALAGALMWLTPRLLVAGAREAGAARQGS